MFYVKNKTLKASEAKRFTFNAGDTYLMLGEKGKSIRTDICRGFLGLGVRYIQT